MTWQVAHGQAQGRRPYQEDRWVVLGAADCGRDVIVAAVFDGHLGDEVADAAPERLRRRAREFVSGDQVDWPGLFAALDESNADAGSTATVALLEGDDVEIAWVGDSRGLIVGRDWVVATRDHRVEHEGERQRMAAHGAQVRGHYFVTENRGLMVSRALGDWALRSVGLIPTPEVIAAGRREVVGVLVATDGLWDVTPSAAAADVVRRARSADEAVRRLMASAPRAADNTTVVVVRRDERGEGRGTTGRRRRLRRAGLSEA